MPAFCRPVSGAAAECRRVICNILSCMLAQMARAVGEGAARTPGKRSLAMEAFATALRAIPTTICDNAGAHTCRRPPGRPMRDMLHSQMLRGMLNSSSIELI